MTGRVFSMFSSNSVLDLSLTRGPTPAVIAGHGPRVGGFRILVPAVHTVPVASVAVLYYGSTVIGLF